MYEEMIMKLTLIVPTILETETTGHMGSIERRIKNNVYKMTFMIAGNKILYFKNGEVIKEEKFPRVTKESMLWQATWLRWYKNENINNKLI
jgi:hypothetical protein